ncbi:Hsp33 family molecular chaperone HslO [Pseudobacteriovorax antillogorgiicola]|uniref:Molecular chaperone Hsp33 n=1 Tax=Pseudobacteriovorax antillogorgiicola TaxID=1513793 RepID=A0A1Y6BAM7_9BACT|nr:Hsp33 family molecular chaperone HslO [Pseudobacteriovorax antillogorgiicola]TCS58519.1 molecular chaperone Hsp33 [Pseudobacteriovorax antillogorgiicola]SME98024.1 molecular chaperone Hsp33 [Pseudobacteriovorax antillogorgiicola]
MTRVKKYLSKDKTIRIASVVSTELVQAAIEHQRVSALSLTLMGRAMTGAVLMAAQLKEDQVVGLHFKGDGPVGSIFTEARYEGKVKVYCENRNADLPSHGKISDGLGSGHLEVVRSLPFQREPHRGTVELVSGEIAEDISYYLKQSHQVPSIVALSTIPGDHGCESAGGYILELMPGYTEETVQRLEALQQVIPPINQLIAKGASESDLVSDYLVNFEFEPLVHPHDTFYQCDCSMERIENSVRTLGVAEIRDMIQENRVFDVTCEFCGKSYQVNPVQLQRIITELKA